MWRMLTHRDISQVVVSAKCVPPAFCLVFRRVTMKLMWLHPSFFSFVFLLLTNWMSVALCVCGLCLVRICIPVSPCLNPKSETYWLASCFDSCVSGNLSKKTVSTRSGSHTRSDRYEPANSCTNRAQSINVITIIIIIIPATLLIVLMSPSLASITVLRTRFRTAW